VESFMHILTGGIFTATPRLLTETEQNPIRIEVEFDDDDEAEEESAELFSAVNE